MIYTSCRVEATVINFPKARQNSRTTCSDKPHLNRRVTFSLLFFFLIWHTGFDFSSCPGWATCPHHPVYSLWRQASQNVSAKCWQLAQLSCSSFITCFPNPEWNSGLVIFFTPSLQKWRAVTSLYYWMDLFPTPSTGKGKTYYNKHRSHFNFVCWIYINMMLFSPYSMFGRVELDSLNPCRVDYVNIKVVTNLEGPFMWDLASS